MTQNTDPLAFMQPWQEALAEVRTQARILLPAQPEEVEKIFDALLEIHAHVCYLVFAKGKLEGSHDSQDQGRVPPVQQEDGA